MNLNKNLSNACTLVVAVLFSLGVAAPARSVRSSAADAQGRSANGLNRTQDYRVVAARFRLQEQLYRAKADAEWEDYAHCVRSTAAVSRSGTRADSTWSLFEYYSYKADQNAAFAARYEALGGDSSSQPIDRFKISVGSLTSGIQPQRSSPPSQKTAAAPASGYVQKSCLANPPPPECS